ncbi:SPFH domain-containing protein, partial [Bacillus cereus]|nr:SPFH domain-containing protein [Bacillus cereus]MEB9692423.1 SPFH domain-containing protein [Bacillus cereus]MEB9692463.1 SPFH domain-containing protein [Bacillus cereus]
RLKKATLNVFSNYSVLEVFQHQGEINGAIEKEFRKMVDTTGFLVDSVTLEAPKPDANTAKAIQGVVDAQQNLEKAEIEKKQATINAEKAIEEARGKAEANEIIKKSLTPEIVEIKKIEKWDGKLPQVSGEANPLVQVK